MELAEKQLNRVGGKWFGLLVNVKLELISLMKETFQKGTDFKKKVIDFKKGSRSQSILKDAHMNT